MDYPASIQPRPQRRSFGNHVSRDYWLKSAGLESTPAPQRSNWIAVRCRHGGYPQLAFGESYHATIADGHLHVCVDPQAEDIQKFPFAVFAPCNPDNWARWPHHLRPLTPEMACN